METTAFTDRILRYPTLLSFVSGVVAVMAMAPFNFFPALLSFSVVVLLIAREPKPWRAALYLFAYGMGYFIVGLYWVQYALVISLGDHWWSRAPALFGLPLLLMPGWVAAGWLAARFGAIGSVARGVLLMTVLALAEYGRAWLMTGFPWNNFAYTWAGVPAMAQMTALGGIYALNAMTILWAATPALWLLARGHRRLQAGFVVVTIVTMVAGFIYGTVRLENNPTRLRDDVTAVIIQPNIAQEMKWDRNAIWPNFQKHITLSQDGLKQIDAMGVKPQTVAIIWPETAIDEYHTISDPRWPASMVNLMKGHDYQAVMVSGLMRKGTEKAKNAPRFFNSITVLTETNDLLAMKDLYDKYRLVPFGEYIPFAADKARAVTGFSGFSAGTGPKVLRAPGMPSVAPLICYETIFPWALKTDGAEWIVNVSNDGWYGDTSGPQQHLAMTRFRAIEQGLPVMRSTTTGVSAVIDSYGRVLKSLPYGEEGQIVAAFPAVAAERPIYTKIRESGLYVLLVLGFAAFGALRRKSV